MHINFHHQTFAIRPLQKPTNLSPLYFVLFFATVPFCRAKSIEIFSNFENVTQTFYQEATGRPYLNFSYSKITKEFKKFKFLRFGLPNFIVHGLRVQFDLASYDHSQILRKLSDFEKKSALRFVFARDSNLLFDFPQNQFLHMEAKILKTGHSENFLIEGARLTTPSDILSYQFLNLSFEHGKPGFQINKNETAVNSPTLILYYGNRGMPQQAGKE